MTLNMIADKLLYRSPLMLILAAIISAMAGVACSDSQKHPGILLGAERMADEYPDSALALLEEIDPSDLAIDSLKAKYYLIKASIHDKQGHLRLDDSLIRYSADFYKDKDLNRAVKSATLSALYDYWVTGDRNAIGKLDSLADIPGLPDSLAIFPLRKRAYWSAKLFDEGGNRPVIKRLISIDKDSSWRQLYRYWLYMDYLFDGQKDSSLVVLDELIDQAVRSKSTSNQFNYEFEKIGVLEDMGRYSESLALADRFLEKAPGNSIEHYIHFWKSLDLFNMGNRDLAIQELQKADSCASTISEAEKGYYNSFTYVLKTVLDFQKTGRLSLTQMAKLNNRQKDNQFRTQYLQQESEQNALASENRRLTLKAESERLTAMIIIIGLSALLITGLSIWYALYRRRKSIEAEEQAETLSKMVKELKNPEPSDVRQDSLRRAMLQQLGIIKMVAETPTEQNREMLRKISSIDSDTEGALVNWGNVFEIIDNLYSGFYTRLHNLYGDLLTDKEEQIIVLMLAGFSTKEISVITSQTTATIYVRKSSVRKKLGVPGKEDITAFLRRMTTP